MSADGIASSPASILTGFSQKKITWSHFSIPRNFTTKTHKMNYQDINSLNFSALSLNETVCSQSSTTGMFKGWGSEETRRAYASLDKLDNSSSHNHSNHHSNHSNHSTNLNTQSIQYNDSSTTNSPQIENDESYSFSDDDDMDCDNFW